MELKFGFVKTAPFSSNEIWSVTNVPATNAVITTNASFGGAFMYSDCQSLPLLKCLRLGLVSIRTCR